MWKGMIYPTPLSVISLFLFLSLSSHPPPAPIHVGCTRCKPSCVYVCCKNIVVGRYARVYLQRSRARKISVRLFSHPLLPSAKIPHQRERRDILPWPQPVPSTAPIRLFHRGRARRTTSTHEESSFKRTVQNILTISRPYRRCHCDCRSDIAGIHLRCFNYIISFG